LPRPGSRAVEVIEDPAITAKEAAFRHRKIRSRETLRPIMPYVILKDGTHMEQSLESARGSERSFATAGERGLIKSEKASPRAEGLEPRGAWARNRRWRTKNLVRHRASHATYMRNWRAKRKAQADSQAPVLRRLVRKDWPNGDCRFRAEWSDGFVLEVQVAENTAVLNAAEWIEEIAITPDGKQFICNACERPTEVLHEAPNQFVCKGCHGA
jgi:hypothetical protein